MTVLLDAPRRPGRLSRTLTALVAGLAVLVGGFALAAPASAAPSCSAGYVCFWTQMDGGGTKYSYFSQANHTHMTASVFYNYNTLPISFWTGNNGTGDIITHYTLSQRGFRNWSSDNWYRCRSPRLLLTAARRWP